VAWAGSVPASEGGAVPGQERVPGAVSKSYIPWQQLQLRIQLGMQQQQQQQQQQHVCSHMASGTTHVHGMLAAAAWLQECPVPLGALTSNRCLALPNTFISAWQLNASCPPFPLSAHALQDCCVFESEAYGTVLVLDGERRGGGGGGGAGTTI
jgi:hypothetical protein